MLHLRKKNKEEQRARIDNDALSFDAMWKSLADNHFNAPHWKPENLWSNKDDRIKDIDPRSPPPEPWSSEQLRKMFRYIKGLFTHCDDFNRRSGNLEGGANIDEADRFARHASNAANGNEAVEYYDLLRSTLAIQNYVFLVCTVSFV